MKILKKELSIPLFDGDKDGDVRVDSIIKYLGEMSAVHNDLTIGDNILKEQDYGWMIRNWKIEIDEYPKIKDKILIKTWVSKVDKFFVNREFNIYRQDKVIIRGTARWIFIDMKRKRPTRLKEEFIDRDYIIKDSNFETFNRYIRDVEYDNLLDFRIRRTDIDNNEHVNNVVYFLWMIENIPKEIYNNKRLKKLEIEYKNEVKYPSEITSESMVYQQGEATIVQHRICRKGSSEISAQGLTKWE